MPSLKLVDTFLVARPALRRWCAWILASLGVALLAAHAAVVHAQADQEKRKKPGTQDGAKASGAKDPGASRAKGAKQPKGAKTAKGKKAAKDAGPASAKPPAGPKTFPSASTIPPRPPVDRKALARAAAEHWGRITDRLLAEVLVREPERAFVRPWPESGERGLGTFGSGATRRWRASLTETIAELQRLEAANLSKSSARAQLHALQDWVEAELLLLDSRTPSTSDPSGYVMRAFRTLRAAREARMAPGERARGLAALLRELPAYLEDARISLIDPPASWIDRALLELDDLQELVLEIQRSSSSKPAPGPKKPAAAEPDARAALEGFRAWLLELRPSAASRAPGPDAGEWQRLASLKSGTPWTASELKARCLREDLDVALSARSAAASALELGRERRFLRTSLAPEALTFELETSARTQAGIARLAGGEDALRILLAQPHGSWPPERTIARSQDLRCAASALGVRYGPAGEALLAFQDRPADETTAVLLDGRLLREGLGLFALEWTSGLSRRANPFKGDEELAFELELQRGLEAARLAAAIEVHAEGLAPEEVALGFERRTGVDRETARAEVLAAEHDPLHGLAFLGLLELRALAERLAKPADGSRGARLCLELVTRHPDLRPSDLAWLVKREAPRRRAGAGAAARKLEKQGGSQPELPRSR